MSSAIQLEEDNERLRQTIGGIKRRFKEQSSSYMRTGISTVTAFGLGAVEAKYGEDAAFGMAPALLVGIAGHGLALLDVGGKDAQQALTAAGDAGLAIYAFKQGHDMTARYMEEPAATGG